MKQTRSMYKESIAFINIIGGVRGGDRCCNKSSYKFITRLCVMLTEMIMGKTFNFLNSVFRSQ
jgi:hypothetical protein